MDDRRCIPEPHWTPPAPGDFDSFYVLGMEHSASPIFWHLLSALMAAARLPLLAVEDLTRAQSAHAATSFTEIARRRGYGVGIWFDADAVPADLLASSCAKILFLRDPRLLLAACYRDLVGFTKVLRERRVCVTPAPATFAEFMTSMTVDGILRRYRRFAQIWRCEPNTTLLRFEHAQHFGWQAIAAELVAALKLPVAALEVMAIAGAMPPAPQDPTESWPAPDDVAEVETRFADVLLAFGYRLQDLAAGSRSEDNCDSTDAAAMAEPLPPSSAKNSPSLARRPPSAIYERDPVLGWRLKPGSSDDLIVLGRRITMDVDRTGCRPVIGQPATAKRTLAVYGCSFTYGIAVSAADTFCSLLQRGLSNWRVENHGVAAYGTARNLMLLERNARWSRTDCVTFCWIQDHIHRDVGSLTWLQFLSRSPPGPDPGEMLRRSHPRAELDGDGKLRMTTVQVPRPELLGIDFTEFTPNAHYTDLVCFRLFERAKQVVDDGGGHFFVTILGGELSPQLTTRLLNHGIPIVNASLKGREYTCLPDDPHPNEYAHRIYAERIGEYLRTLAESAL